MTDQTYDGQNIGKIYHSGNPHKELAIVATGQTIYPGHGIRVRSSLAYASKSTDKEFSGVAEVNPGEDIDTAITAGVQFEYYPVGQDTEVYVRLEATSPIVACRIGTPAAVGTEDGKFRVFAYTNAADITDSVLNITGRFMEYDAGSTSDDHIVLMRLST